MTANETGFQRWFLIALTRYVTQFTNDENSDETVIIPVAVVRRTAAMYKMIIFGTCMLMRQLYS